jgi:hypothetical protein
MSWRVVGPGWKNPQGSTAPRVVARRRSLVAAVVEKTGRNTKAGLVIRDCSEEAEYRRDTSHTEGMRRPKAFRVR